MLGPRVCDEKGQKSEVKVPKSGRMQALCDLGVLEFRSDGLELPGETIMAEVFTEDYIAKILLLEKAVGHKVPYRILDPFHVHTESADGYVDMQRAAKRIAEFVGLMGLTFLIEPTHLAEGTCGRIELQSAGSEVFVQISSDLFGFPSALLATISHEIAHKFLHTNRITWGDGLADHYHNEVLTDIAGVFVGLGKLMLNGHHVERTDEGSSGRTTHTRRVGYLEGNQLAFVYLLMCHMRQVGREDLFNGLTPHSSSIVREQEAIFGPYFQQNFHDADQAGAFRRKVVSLMENVGSEERNFLKTVGDLRESLYSLESETLRRVHARTDSINSKLSELNSDDLDPCLRYLNALRLDQLLRRAQSEMHCATDEIEESAALAASAKRGLIPTQEPPGLSLRRIARIFSARR
jgi:hypothetical protein